MGQPLASILGGLYAIGGQTADPGGSSLAAFSQFAHFRGNHGKASAVLASTRRFHRCIKRQQIRFTGDFLDDTDFGGNVFNGRNGLSYGLTAGLGILCSR